MKIINSLLLFSLLTVQGTWGWNNPIARRDAIASSLASIVGVAGPLVNHASNDETDTITTTTTKDLLHYRDRMKTVKEAIIREDYWYMMGKIPPRKLDAPLTLDDPQWNTFGSCVTSGGAEGSTNSCTYVSLKQRIPAYSKYAFNIALGAKEYKLLGKELFVNNNNNNVNWDAVASYVTTLPSTPPPPPVDAQLKMVLLSSALLTSPNYSGPSLEVLVARFYVNEVNFALKEIERSIATRDVVRAQTAWDFGRDSWNSYFQVVNRPIVPKVGDKFDLIESIV